MTRPIAPARAETGICFEPMEREQGMSVDEYIAFLKENSPRMYRIANLIYGVELGEASEEQKRELLTLLERAP
jgi:hypothetical protein